MVEKTTVKHILFTLRGCPFELLDDKEFIRMLLYRATKECKSTLLNLATHKFDPQGVTGVAMLAESHISIHTWPEKGVAKCDIFTCGDKCDPHKAVEYLGNAFKANTGTAEVHYQHPLTFEGESESQRAMTGMLTYEDSVIG